MIAIGRAVIVGETRMTTDGSGTIRMTSVIVGIDGIGAGVAAGVAAGRGKRIAGARRARSRTATAIVTGATVAVTVIAAEAEAEAVTDAARTTTGAAAAAAATNDATNGVTGKRGADPARVRGHRSVPHLRHLTRLHRRPTVPRRLGTVSHGWTSTSTATTIPALMSVMCRARGSWLMWAGTTCWRCSRSEVKR
jgi:hypothetical protein